MKETTTFPANKKEFMENPEPLILIVSFDPATGKSTWDYYNPLTSDGWLKEFEKDFPDCIHFTTRNRTAVKERKKQYGLE